MASKTVTPAAVRAWARENLDAIPEDARPTVEAGRRGRLNPDVTKAFKAAHKGTKVERPARTVTVRIAALDKNGKAITKNVTLTTAEARDLLGQSGVRGRFNKADLALAVEARELADA